MTEAQLKTQLKTNEYLKEDLETVKKSIKTTEAAAALQDFCTKTDDPLRDGNSPTNPFTAKGGGGGGGCNMI